MVCIQNYSLVCLRPMNYFKTHFTCEKLFYAWLNSNRFGTFQKNIPLGQYIENSCRKNKTPKRAKMTGFSPIVSPVVRISI